MNEEHEVLAIAFSMVKGVNASLARRLEETGIGLEEFFRLSAEDLTGILMLNPKHRIGLSSREDALRKAREEYSFTRKHSIRSLYICDESYPYRLRELEDAPVILYKLGDADLNSGHSLAFVGTRNSTPYGVKFCTQSIMELSGMTDDLMIVSGLAFGIDSSAHKATLAVKGVTTAVLAHGLDMIYPSSHRGLAGQILKQGGALVSEYPRGERPFKQRFLQRNRIIAGMSDGVVVAESGIKGGAMSTANIAFTSNRDVMALPGRSNDSQSEGCNYLIKKQKAQLVTSASDIIETMGWDDVLRHVDAVQMNLFPELNEDQQEIFKVLKSHRTPVSVDEICVETGMAVSIIVAGLSEMEFDGTVIRYAGNRYTTA